MCTGILCLDLCPIPYIYFIMYTQTFQNLEKSYLRPFLLLVKISDKEYSICYNNVGLLEDQGTPSFSGTVMW